MAQVVPVERPLRCDVYLAVMRLGHSIHVKGKFNRPWCPLVAAACLLFAAKAFGIAGSRSAEATRLNNLGVAYMNQQLLDKALSYFQQAVHADASLTVPHLNAGIALMVGQHDKEAKAEFESALKCDPHSAPAWYNLGLLYREQNDPEAMTSAFEKVIENDPASADAHYFLGVSYSERKDYPSAVREYLAALALQPLHASAEFGLARTLQRVGDADGAHQHLERFQRLTREKLSSPLAQAYGEQGQDSLAEAIRSDRTPVGPMIPVAFQPMPFMGDAVAGASPKSQQQGSGAVCEIDRDGHGDPDVIVIGPGSEPIQYLHHQPGGGFQRLSAAQTGLAAQGRGVACAVGDFDNDGHPDVAIAMSDRVVLYRNQGDGTFADVTAQAGIKPVNNPAGLTFLDFDHDGDLDLFITGASRSSSTDNVLWRNNGNSTFTEWTGPTGLGGIAPTASAVLSDLNSDRAVDLAVAGNAGVTLFMNQREGKFVSVPLYADKTLAPALGVTVLDFNKDGLMDLAVTHDGAPGVTLWKNLDGTHFQRVALPLPGVLRAYGITPIDFDNDGWIDLAAVVDTAKGTEVRVLRNIGPGGFQDVTAQVGLKGVVLPGARAALAWDVDGDGASDLVISRTDALPLLLHNAGGSRHHSIKIALRGLADNKTGLGVKVEVFAGGLWQKWEVAGASGFLSQGAPTVLAGLGDSSDVEIVRLLWPTGVPQDEIEATPKTAIELTELDRRGSSCPVVFAWDGHKYGFVTDTIGAAVVGHWVSPTARNKPDPDEWIKVDGTQLKSRNGLLSLRLGEPMEEVNYIDQVKLLAVDHPAQSEVFPNERFKNEPPFAEEKTIFTRDAHAPAGVWDDAGREVSPLLRERDHQYLKDFTNLHYDGFANLHHMTLDLGEWSPAMPLRLLMTGFIEYFSASSLYSAWQAGLAPLSPYVEAQMPDGSWKRVVDDMGFPAGLNRTMIADLTGKIPAGVRRIRITTNLQIYWDQILISNEPEAPQAVRQTLAPLVSASLAFRGYPRQIDGKTPGDLTYDYDQVSYTGPFVRAAGLYTHYGDVTPLLQSVDNQAVVFGSGEDIDLEFREADLPPLPKGWVRDYFFYANGYVKDMDFYEASPATVAEMPFHGMSGYPYADTEHFPDSPAAVAYQLLWNDRADRNHPQADYQFHYGARRAVPESLSH